jgi:hypothetical protein
MAAGAAYAFGGIGFLVSRILVVLGAFDPPFDDSADEVAAWFGGIGFLMLVAAATLTLLAMGRRGRRPFLVVLAATTLTIATYQFWTTNWVVRFGDVATYCSDAGYAPARDLSIQRLPPGVRCSEWVWRRGEEYARAGDEVFVPADGISWLALGGFSLFYGFAASFPIMGLAWLARRLPLPHRPDFGLRGNH